ncbi:PASTA domain-containing protein [uncultured Cetobacterium sp.]|uniref:PASTA domain-containing protein n=2 Tax=uncultured Cetobacterium sp. TaxID=527638 RepID=UPI00261DA2E5|nr:PASTA domain-containing protein [uncultured Cetobacterium sp.]
MKKYLAYLVSGILIIFICFFSFNIFLKIYFNERFYSLPNLVGLTLSDIKQIKSVDKITIVNAGSQFSNFPAGTIFMQNPSAGKTVKEGRDVRVWISKGEDNYEIPDFINNNLVNVLPDLHKNGVKIKKITYTTSNLPYNTIIATNPTEGSLIKKDIGLSFLLSKSNTQSSIEVPDTIGFTLDEATKSLTSKGLIIGEITEKVVPGLEKGIVIEATHTGETVHAGTIIDMVVSY